jgi:hypothetical protein
MALRKGIFCVQARLELRNDCVRLCVSRCSGYPPEIARQLAAVDSIPAAPAIKHHPRPLTL